MKPDAHANLKVLFALTLVHFTGDFYSAFTTPLFPAFMDKLNLSLAQVGMIAGINRFLSFIVQPIAGYLADRYQGRAIILGGLLMAVVFIPLSGVAGSYWMLVLFIALGSVGSSLFHPSVAGMIPLYAGNRKGFSMSVFNTGGTLAFAAGPFFITAVVAAWGLEAMPATMVIGLMVMVYLWVVVPSPQSEGMAALGLMGTLKRQFGTVWKSIFLIWLVMVLRAVVGQSFMTFMPVLLVSRGYSLVSGGVMITLFTLSGTVSGLMAGYLADRAGSRPIFLVAHLLMTPALLVMLWLPGPWIYAGVFVAGFFVLATMPLGVTLAQELAPGGRSMVSSLMMGLAYGLGGAMAPVVGRLADLYSIASVLWAVAFIPLVTIPLILLFPRGRTEAAAG
ncbi:MFS transporter [Desulfosarcina alkanivorans]|jgi:FSR family fosmidomycin resistance protein-like MFS transporter|uniref:MFS transporter n=2 Tax=Desulfosarcina alkanivorans TaxID=571177 RepID=A0A5K7YUT8_9BACT|nr:MFS transporter [Desulfosarcina alkanivorans]